MLLGTETLLTYDTKITFKNKPKNLKFYTDREKKQELIVENEKYLAFNGFMALEDNRKRDIPIYWEWNFETGNSEKEIEYNDIIDSDFMGKTMSMQIDVTGTQVMSNPYADGVASTTINGKITVYDSVQNAINGAGINTGAVITLLQGGGIEESISIASNQNIVLNMNGKTLESESDAVGITNSGTLKITGNGIVTSNVADRATIVNTGKLQIIDGMVSSANKNAINNNGTGQVTVLGGVVEALGYAIVNNAVITENITENIIITGDSQIIAKGTTSSCAINQYSAGKIKIDGGVLKTTDEVTNLNGTINTDCIRVDNGVIEIQNGVIESKKYAALVILNSAVAYIEGGTISGYNQGIWSSNGSHATINIGKNDGKVNTASPVIIAHAVANNTTGISVGGSTVYLNDGVIKVPRSSNYGTIHGTVTYPSGYHIANDTETIDGTEYLTAYLEKD